MATSIHRAVAHTSVPGAQLNSVLHLMAEARGGVRSPLADVAAQWAEFSGWLHTATGRAHSARQMYDRAAEWASEAGNVTMQATILSFKGHLAYLLGQCGPTIGLSRAAQRDSRVWVGQRAYDAIQEARGLAMTGDTADITTAVRKLNVGAERAALASDSGEAPPWLYYYTAPFFILERGWVCRLLGRTNPAHTEMSVDLLTSGLAGLNPAERESEWAAVYVTQLATAYAQAGSPDLAAEQAIKAATVARATGSAQLLRALRDLHDRMTKVWPYQPDIAVLGEALA